MLTKEQKQQFSDILEELGKTLDISETQFNAAVQSYNAVATQLSKAGSFLEYYKPEIRPQGSFLLGTMIKPINEEDDVDIDLVCELQGKNDTWTQKTLKENVGLQLKENDLYKSKVKLKNGRRCWTLYYRETSDDPSQRYHLDILPSIIDTNYIKLFTESYSAIKNIQDLAIRITDNERTDYSTEANHQNWLKSNPIGYGKWFFHQADIGRNEVKLLSEAIQPVPEYKKEKLPLQRVVQILKRHRDMMWKDRDDKDDKPISIIITTLAGHSYDKDSCIIDSLVNVVPKMRNFISETNPHTGAREYWVANPVNNQENFADKWKTYPKRKDNFFAWIDAIERDIQSITKQKEITMISEAMKKPFGSELITKTFSNYGEKILKQRESGAMKMAAGTGMLGETGRTSVPQHKPFGRNE